jgi:drug/metabolite transporter (DMT)-like permease
MEMTEQSPVERIKRESRNLRGTLTESLADELKDRGITVNAILPGTIDTPRNRSDMPDADFSRWVTPDAIADVVLYLASDGAQSVTGAAIPGQLGPGVLMAVASAVLFSWGSYHTVRDMPKADALTRTVVTSFGALIFIAAAFAAFLALGLTALPPLPPGLPDLGLIALYGMLAFGVSQLGWIAAADRLGVAVAAFHINTAPFYVMLILTALGAPWSWPQALGAAIVAAGVFLAQRR